MPRLRNSVTGAVVSVGDTVAGRLGPEWVSADQPPPTEARKPRASRTRKPDDD